MPDPELPSPVAEHSRGAAPDRRPANPWAIIALILGLFSQLYPYLPSFGFDGVPLLTTLATAVLALVLSVIGLLHARRGSRGLGLSSAALTCAILTLINWAWRLLVILSFRHWTF